MNDKLLTVNQVAARLGVTIYSVRRYLGDGRLKGFKLGGNGKSNRPWRIRECDLEAFMEAHSNG